jgi:hypothetical protein
MKTKINAQIVAHSKNEQGDELISVLATFPRIILAEVNTHRMLSKNTSSSRAIPFNKMVETIQNDPFIPIAWQKEHKGMQGSEYFENTMLQQALWLEARNSAVDLADRLNSGCGVTKQLCNRLLEPFMWTTMLITGPKSGWDNFFNLRCPQYEYITKEDITYFKSKKDWTKKFYESKVVSNTSATIEDINTYSWFNKNKGQAEIHIMALAECIWDAYNESTPKILIPGEWHIPFLDKIETDFEEIAVKVSTAMAARTSYTVVGNEKEIDIDAMVVLHDRLLAQDPPHSSPLEHCARAMSEDEYRGNIKGKINLINDREFQTEFAAMTGYTPLSGACEEKALGWCNNLKGFIPYRYMVDNGNQTSKD